MKKILKKKVDNLDFYKIFKPELTPKKMMELGVFGGAYFGLNVKEYPKAWFKNVKLSKTFDVNLNRFKIVSRLSREHWIEKVGFSKKILWVGFSGIVDLLMEEEFHKWMKFKLRDGKF